MARITIDIPDELAVLLVSRSEQGGLSQGELVADALRARLGLEEAPALDAERAARIRQGLDDADAGRVLPHHRVRPWLRALARGEAEPTPG